MYSSARNFVAVSAGKVLFVGTEPFLEQNLVNHLFLGLNQYVNDHQELMMHLDTPLLVEILVLVADLMY